MVFKKEYFKIYHTKDFKKFLKFLLDKIFWQLESISSRFPHFYALHTKYPYFSFKFSFLRLFNLSISPSHKSSEQGIIGWSLANAGRPPSVSPDVKCLLTEGSIKIFIKKLIHYGYCCCCPPIHLIVFKIKTIESLKPFKIKLTQLGPVGF